VGLGESLQTALAHHRAGRLRQAEELCREVLRTDPDNAEGHLHLADVLADLGEPAEAEAAYRRAIGLRPDFAEAHDHLGGLLHDQGRYPEAVHLFQEAIRLRPGWAAAHHHLGDALDDLGRPAEAASAYREAVRLDPGLTTAHHQLGHLLEELGDPDGARACFEEPLRRAASAGARVGAALTVPEIMPAPARLARQRRRLEEAVARLAREGLRLDDPLTQVGVTSFFPAYHGHNDRDLQAALAALYSRAAPSLHWVAPHCAAGPVPSPAGRSIRVGFVSGFFHTHTIGEVNLGFIRNLSRSVCQVLLFPFPGPDDPLARLIRKSADKVVDLPADLAGARARIAAERLDALFYTDIGMDPRTYFLAFARLAPVQCTTWGHPVTTGLPTMDYYLSGAHLEPEGAEGHYTEELVRLSGLPTFYYPPAFFPPAKPREYFGLKEGEHVYLCPQAPFKFHPDFDALLGGILRADPRGRLYFVRSRNPAWTRQLTRRLRRRLPDVFGRVGFLPHQGGQDFLHLLNVCDAVLDTTPFGGGNTTYKALSVAAPVVTLPGRLARGRVTYACYRKMGVPDLVATDAGDYVRLAVRLTADRPWRQEVRAKIGAARGALFEDPQALRELERFLVAAVERSRGQATAASC
jgi:predicted O-linked N-acetylglucosamine transferase (SPINDLY family)